MNLYDGELVSRLLTQEGFALTSSIEEAQVILFNTCSVRDHAEKRVLGRIQTLSGLKRKRPGLILGVLGCMGQRLGEDLRNIAPGVDLVLGPDAYRALPQLLKAKLDGGNGHHYFCAGDADETYGDILPQRRAGVNAFVAIMRGCNNFCSYCIVPYARGRERSRPVEEILNEIRAAVADGFPEVTLLGQNVNSYRWGEVDFPGLLQEVDRIEGLARIRFMTSHPRDLGDKLISVMARGGKLCPSLHLPVQSGSDRILEMMGRGYTRVEYLKKVAQLRREVTDLTLSTDLLCGFPGEKNDDFGQTLELMEEAAFDSAFTFKYSPRPGTNAANMRDDVPEAVKIERLYRLLELGVGIFFIS
jgi:tRNA-2-methylthio-N6-dimethylallyladenosine synthase